MHLSSGAAYTASPAIHLRPDLQSRLDLLGGTARFESVGPVYCGGPEPLQAGAIYHATSAQGRSVPLLKVLLTDHCHGTCRYCAFRAARDTPRTSLEPGELAQVFDRLVRQGKVQGLFLSSGLDPDPVTAMTRQLEAAEIVRRKYGFRGYMHLKILPGCETAQVEYAARLGSRLSLNLEAPSRERLQALAPGKSLPLLLRAHIQHLGALVQRGLLPSSGWTTQFVVGPAGETDQELLGTSQGLYNSFRLTRAYYSRFEPISGTPLESAAPTSRRRQRRLYEADTLLRAYGFQARELVFDAQGSLDPSVDPKESWARAHPERFPLPLERAEPAELLRVPGIGPRLLARLLVARQEGALGHATSLRRLGISARRSGSWITLGGRLQGSDPGCRQLPLFQTPLSLGV